MISWHYLANDQLLSVYQWAADVRWLAASCLASHFLLFTAFSVKVWRTNGRTNGRTNERNLAIISLDNWPLTDSKYLSRYLSRWKGGILLVVSCGWYQYQCHCKWCHSWISRLTQPFKKSLLQSMRFQMNRKLFSYKFVNIFPFQHTYFLPIDKFSTSVLWWFQYFAENAFSSIMLFILIHNCQFENISTTHFTIND